MRRTLGGLHGSRTARTTSFEVLVSPLSFGLPAQAVGYRSLLFSTPSRTGAGRQPLHFPHGEYATSPGPQSHFPACAHGADRQPTAVKEVAGW
jgi:hypothetical protein